ncbi:hypothetical protein [Parasphingopyxis sp.]|uniref:hypothetical protein n=1 Tax=Parasphingopyxis sp. TaxID=1920299 RepID=UPI002630F330|nr:hypothetical protein [Parasphingopyxis sp.]
MMGLSKQQLTFKALVALTEIVEQSRQKPVSPSAGLRFILAWLFTMSGVSDRSAYDEFWRVVQDPMENAYSDHHARYIRGTSAQTALNVIARNAGIELTSDMLCQMSQARMTQAEREKYRQSAHHRFSEQRNNPPHP